MLEVIRSSCPYPTIREDGELHDGLLIPQAKKCRQCVTRSCRRLFGSNGEYVEAVHEVCEYNYSVVAIPTMWGLLVVNGIFVPNLNKQMLPPAKKANRGRKIPLEQISEYRNAIRKSEPALLQAVEQQTPKVVSGIHDIRTAINLIYRNAEAIVKDLPGGSMEEKIAEAPPDLRRLLISVRLMKSRLELASIASNPESAQYGQRRSTPIYKICHRMVRLFEQEAVQRNISISMNGMSFKSYLLYDSFESIPLILIDNAIKYAYPNTHIDVTVSEKMNHCFVSVESYGEIVSAVDVPRIFEKGFRSEAAKSYASGGAGLGLYIASLVARANGFTIHYSSKPDQIDDRVGVNCFSFAVR